MLWLGADEMSDSHRCVLIQPRRLSITLYHVFARFDKMVDELFNQEQRTCLRWLYSRAGPAFVSVVPLAMSTIPL